MSNVRNGFSIIEVIIAVFVIVVGLVAMMNLMANSLKHTIDSRNLIIASGLAQEGVELVKNIRDNSWLDPPNETDPFDDFPGNGNPDKNNCRIDYTYTDAKDAKCSSSVSHKKLKYNAGFYEHANGTDTKFQRKLVFSYPVADKAIVQSIVIWSRADNDFPTPCATANKCVMVEDILTNWR